MGFWGEHDEARVVSSSKTDVIQIIESQAELGADQRVGRRIQLASHAVRLEAEDACCHEVNIITPASDHWVALNRSARNPGTRQRCLKTWMNLVIAMIPTYLATLPRR